MISTNITTIMKAGLFALMLIAPITANGQGRVTNTTRTVPNDYELTVLIQATLAALNHANRTGNYSVLHDLSAEGFRRINSPKRLAMIFAGHRARALDISAALLYAPVFSQPPRIDNKGFLHLKGHMPTEPFHIKFALIYEKSGSHWRIMALSIAPAQPGS